MTATRSLPFAVRNKYPPMLPARLQRGASGKSGVFPSCPRLRISLLVYGRAVRLSILKTLFLEWGQPALNNPSPYFTKKPLTSSAAWSCGSNAWHLSFGRHFATQRVRSVSYYLAAVGTRWDDGLL